MENQSDQQDRPTPSEPDERFEGKQAPKDPPRVGGIRDGRSPARGESKDRRLVERSETK